MKQTTLLSSFSKAILYSKKQREFFKKLKEEKKEKEEKKLEEEKKNLEAYKKYREENNLRKKFRSNKFITKNQNQNKDENKQIIKKADPIIKELNRSSKMQNLFIIPQYIPKIYNNKNNISREIDENKNETENKFYTKELLTPNTQTDDDINIQNNVESNVKELPLSEKIQDPIIKVLNRSEKMHNLFIPQAVQEKRNISLEIDEIWDDTCVVMYDIIDTNISDKEIDETKDEKEESDKSCAVNYDNLLELEREPDLYKRLDEELTEDNFEDSDKECDEESNDESDEESVLESNKVCFRNTQIVKLYGNKGIEDLADSSFKVNILNSKSETIGVVLSFDNSYIK